MLEIVVKGVPLPAKLQERSLTNLLQIPRERSHGQGYVIIGMVRTTQLVSVGEHQVPVVRCHVFAWRLHDGELRFDLPVTEEASYARLLQFVGLNIHKLFERPSLFSLPPLEDCV